MILGNYEYIPREVEVNEIRYFPTNDYWIFTTGVYKEVKVKKTIYDRYKRVPKIDGFGYDLIKWK